jgi:ATP-dependent helicase IRC3
MATTLTLRPYQQDALDGIHAAFEKGTNKQVAVLATGLGKTVIFSHLISQRIGRDHKKALILAHREELLLQAKDKLLSVDPTLRVGIEQAEHTADHAQDDVVIASVATIGKENSTRLSAFNPSEYSTIIVDEAHHASAISYKNILQYFQVLKNSPYDTNKQILLLGVTATPNRNDNKGIDTIFDDVVYKYDIIDGIKSGWLSRIRAIRIDTSTDISSVKELAGDFSTQELASVVNNPERNALILKTYQDIAPGKQALIFAADVAHTEALYEVFKHAGVKVAFVTGETDKDMRKELLEQFAKKEIHVMVNAMVLTEGYDNAGIEFVFMTRPTQSGILYQQMIGRGTRIHPGKEHLMVVDFVDNTLSHTLQTSASLLGLEGRVNFQGEDILDMKSRLDLLREKRPGYDLNKLDVKKIEYLIKEVDILEEKRRNAPVVNYEWHQYGEHKRMKIGENRYYFVEQTLTDRYALREQLPSGQTHLISTFDSSVDAMKYTNSLITKQFSSIGATQAPTGQVWESDIPSEAQIQLLRNLGARESEILMLTKGDASKLISRLKVRR